MSRRAEDAAIGIFDSGSGGLTCIPAIRNLMPRENIVYFGDTVHMPYGNRPSWQLREFSENITRFLLKQGAKAILIACNTLSAAVLPELRREFPGVAIVGMIKPAVEKISKTCPTGAEILLIGTDTTVSSGEYSKKIAQLRPDLMVRELACPGLADIVENFGPGTPEATKYLTEKFYDLKERDIYLVTACTHYPILLDDIRRICPYFKILNPSEIVAEALKRELKKQKLLKTETGYYVSKGDVFYASRLGQRFTNLARQVSLANNESEAEIKFIEVDINSD